MLRSRLLEAVLCLLGFCSLYLSAQVALNLGSVSGTVTDETGAAISAAHVTVSLPDKTVVRDAVTGEDGGFTIGNLPSGTYQMDITAPGFAHYRNEAVAVAVGRDWHVEARLGLEQTSEQLSVQAEAGALDPSQTSSVTNIDRDRIEELPIPSRNYLSFTLLAPTLGSANPAFGLKTPAGSEGGFSADGLRPSSNALYIDGVDDNDEYTGLSRTELSPEAISDFQVVNHGYAAESGGAAGGSVDVETRSGANTQHGDAFIFIQNGALNATPPLELVPSKPSEDRVRLGLSTGGPLRKDKFFYYIAAEQEIAHGHEANDFTPQEAKAIYAVTQQTGPLRDFSIHQSPFPTTDEETELSGRVDRPLKSNALMLRYALTNNRAVNDAFNTDDLSDLSTRGSAFYNDSSVNGTWSDPISPVLLNQFNFEVAQRRVVMRTGESNGPGVLVAGVAQFGTPYAGNSRRYETHVDVADGVSKQSGKHLLKIGASLSHVALRAANMEGFGGLYVFQDLASLTTGQADFYVQSFGDPDTNFSEARIAGYMQDHWAGIKNLSLDFGLRYEYNHLPAPLPQDADNFSPCLGFAWSPGQRWVLRGGFGTYSDRYLLSTINRIREFDGVHAFQQVAEGNAAAAFYQSSVQFSAPHVAIAPSVWRAYSGMANPYSETASFGIDRSFSAQWTASGEFRFARGVKMGRTINSNLLPPVPLTLANAASLGIPAPTPQQLGRLIFPQGGLDASYGTINEFQSEANSNYNGITVKVNRQFTEEFELLAGYTFSKTLDDASYDAENPQNPYAVGDERAVSLGDQRHRFVVSGLWVLGPDLDQPQTSKRRSSGSIQRALTGLEFAPIFAIDSGFHNNAVTGLDTNREAIYPFAARPLDVSRNNLTTPVNANFNLRILKMVPIWRGHLDIVAESFNLLNRQNVEVVNPVFGTGTAPAPNFAAPLQATDARRLQFSLDFEY